MSLCIRTVSNKLTSFVGTRQAATRVDRELPKHIEKTSTFFEELLSNGTTAKNESREPVIASNLLSKPLKTTSDNIVAWNYKLRNDNNNWNIEKNRQDCIDDVAKTCLSNESGLKKNSSATVFSVAEKEGIVRSESSPSSQPNSSTDNPLGKPSQDQLSEVYEVLRSDLPDFFIKSIDYRIYDVNIEFHNNFKGTVTTGIYEYVKQAAMFRTIAHIKYAYVKFEVLKITVHPEDDSVKVRWRVRGLTGLRVFLQFWKLKVWKIATTIDSLDSWYDGFSTFYVGGHGKIVKHVADKMMPDQDIVMPKDKSGMAAKLALFLGLFTPREFLTDIGPLMAIGVDEKERDSSKTDDSTVEQIE